MAFCTQCGAAIDEGNAFCIQCGAPVQQPSATQSGKTAAMPSAPHPSGQQAYGNAPQDAPAVASLGAPAPARPGGINQRTIIIACAVIAAIAVIAIIVVLLVQPAGKKAYSVTFESNGGTTLSAATAEPGATIAAPANPTKAGYVFEGWYTDANLTQQATFPYRVEKDTVLYAKWAEKGAAQPGGASGNTANGTTSTNTQNNNGNGGATNASKNTVTLSVRGADGSTRNADIRRQGSTQRVLPEGSTRRLTASDVTGLSDAERCIAWNEIIAASNGYAFKNSGLASYFDQCSWYHPNPGASASGNLTADQSANVDLLKSYTDSWWMNLATY